jgi:hypothetical protein
VNFLRAIAILSFLLCLADSPAQAADGAVPAALQQKYWSVPDCQFTEMYLIVTDHFTLRLDRMRPHAERIKSAEEKNGDDYVTDGEKVLILHPDGRGGMTQYPDETKSFKIPYELCPAIAEKWKTIDEGGLALFGSLESLLPRCGSEPGGIGKNPACRRAVFDLFDKNSDGGLDADELARAYRSILWLSTARSCNFDEVFPAEYVDSDAHDFADEMHRLVDINGDGHITLPELEERWPVLNGTRKPADLLNNAAALYELLPFLPKSGPHPTCLVCRAAPAPESSSCAGGNCGK